MKNKMIKALLVAMTVTAVLGTTVPAYAQEMSTENAMEAMDFTAEEVSETAEMENAENIEDMMETIEDAGAVVEEVTVEDRESIPAYYDGDSYINIFIWEYKDFPNTNNKVNAMSGLMAYNIAVKMGKSSYESMVWGHDIENEMGNIGYEAVKEKYGLDFLDDAQWISGFESYFDEPAGTTPAMVLGLKPRPSAPSTPDTPSVGEDAKLNGMCWVYRNDYVDVGVSFDAPPTTQFRWTSYNLDTQEWKVISDWNTGNWISWYGEKGNYWLRCEMRTADGRTDELTQCFAYTAGNTQINGTYAGYRNSNEILLGCSSAMAGQGETYSFKIYNIDTGEWIYLTDKNLAQWVSWTPKNGNYWTHFELYTKDGRLADTKTYCFAVQGR